MIGLNTKQQWKKRLYSRPAFALLLILALIGVKGAWNLYSKKVESEENLAAVGAQAEELRARQLELEEQIARLETNQGIEEEIRKKFSVVRDGEQMVVLVDEQATASAKIEEEQSFFEQSWNKVKGIFTDDE